MAEGWSSCPRAHPASALRKGSLVVNSSQGGGSKDTWVLEEDEAPVAKTEKLKS